MHSRNTWKKSVFSLQFSTCAENEKASNNIKKKIDQTISISASAEAK